MRTQKRLISMKKRLSLLFIYFIVAITLTLLFVVIPFEKTVASWLAYGFALLSLVGGLVIIWVAFRKATTLKSKFYGFPVVRVGLIYSITQIIISIILIVIGVFVEMPTWIVVILSVVLIAFTSIGTIVSDNMRDAVETIEEHGHQNTQVMTSLTNNLANILDLCQDEAVKAKLVELNERFKYSDPVSSESTQSIEHEITENITQLKELVLSNNNAQSLKIIGHISNLLSSRNRICSANK